MFRGCGSSAVGTADAAKSIQYSATIGGSRRSSSGSASDVARATPVAFGERPPFRNRGIGVPPILQFSTENLFAINKSAIPNPTEFWRAYTALVSCWEAEVDN